MKIIISERQYKLLTENIPEIDSIIDKISSVGLNNLNDNEKELLKNSMANEQAIVDKAAENELLNNRERAQRRMEFLDTQNKENLKAETIDVKQLEAAYSPKTKAVMIAHSLGNPFNLQEVVNFCRKHNLWLVEDCCDALGATYRGQMVGTFGDISTLSFYPAHHITMGEGGVVFTNNSELKMIAESFRDWGRDCYCDTGKDNTCQKRFEWQLGELPEGGCGSRPAPPAARGASAGGAHRRTPGYRRGAPGGAGGLARLRREPGGPGPSRWRVRPAQSSRTRPGR